MKSLYWRPQKISRRTLFSIGLLSVMGFTLVEFCPMTRNRGDLAPKWEAAQSARDMMLAIKAERHLRGIPIHSAFDSADTGMLGSPMTLITSRPGDLAAKQTSINPNFAAVVVDLLQQAGVKRGDTVAVGWSGSFPAFNVSVAAALQAMDVRPIVIASATSSQYGANDPEFLWIDMENALRQQGHLSFGSSAVSIGGAADRGLGMSSETLAAIQTAIDRNDIPMLAAERRAISIERRMELYSELAAGRSIKAYINVGGGVASTGGHQGKRLFRAGLNRKSARTAETVDCVMYRFASQGRPVIHLADARQLAESYALPIAPPELPEVGDGRAFSRTSANRGLAAAVLLTILFTLRSYLISTWGSRIESWFASLRARRNAGLRVVSESNAETPLTPEPQLMV